MAGATDRWRLAFLEGAQGDKIDLRMRWLLCPETRQRAILGRKDHFF